MYDRIIVLIAVIATSWAILVPDSFSAPPNPAAGGPVRAEIDKCAAVLRSGAPHEQKLAACKRLALIGGAESVPILAPLLVDKELSHAARIALEAIPDAAAAASLRKAIPGLKGKLLVGVINSLGERRDPQAAVVLTALLTDADVEVGCAAARALGRIGTSESTDALENAISTAGGQVRVAVGDALLACAESLLRQSNSKEAAAVYEIVSKSELPKSLRLAAVRGEILASGAAGIGLLVAQLMSLDEEAFAAALGVCREAPGAEATRAIADAIACLTPRHQCQLLGALADRGDSAARPAVRKAVGSAEPAVRMAAISALATLGDASDLELLTAAAVDPDPQIAVTAAAALTMLDGPGMDRAFVGMLDKAKGRSRRMLVEVMGQRRIAQAVPELLKVADDPDKPTRLAAIGALGATVAADQLSVLTARVMASKSPEELAAAQTALRAACVRSIDKNTCAEKLAVCLREAGLQNKLFLLELLGAIGGPNALEAVAASASDPSEDVQDVATRVLGRWMTPNAAPVLLEASRKSANLKLRTRALRGYVRIIRQMDIPDERRLTMCRDAMAAAERDEERVLVIQALGRIASPAVLAEVVPFLKTPALKQAAASSAVSIAEKIVVANPAVAAAAVQKVLAASPDDATARRANAVLLRAGTKLRP